MFAQEVFIEKLFLHGRKLRVQRERMILHEGDFLQDNGRLDCLFGGVPPAERTVTLNQDRRDCVGINLRE